MCEHNMVVKFGYSYISHAGQFPDGTYKPMHETVKIGRRRWGDDCTRCLLALSACLILDLLCAQSALVMLKNEVVYVDNIL